MEESHYEKLTKKITSVVCAFAILNMNLYAYATPETYPKKQDASEFDRFLNSCSDYERVVLSQSLGYLPKIPNEAYESLFYKNSFGNIELSLEDSYTHNAKDIAANKVVIISKVCIEQSREKKTSFFFRKLL